ncbi:MAG TPA: hypothetical protein VGF67_30130 [Ktedonobacteraceae bacterium]
MPCAYDLRGTQLVGVQVSDYHLGTNLPLRKGTILPGIKPTAKRLNGRPSMRPRRVRSPAFLPGTCWLNTAQAPTGTPAWRVPLLR